MPAVFGTAHADDIAALRRRGHDPILLEAEQVALMFGGRIEAAPPNCRYILVILPRPILQIVAASDPVLFPKGSLRFVKD